jgi:hypothetical protein
MKSWEKNCLDFSMTRNSDRSTYFSGGTQITITPSTPEAALVAAGKDADWVNRSD